MMDNQSHTYYNSFNDNYNLDNLTTDILYSVINNNQICPCYNNSGPDQIYTNSQTDAYIGTPSLHIINNKYQNAINSNMNQRKYNNAQGTFHYNLPPRLICENNESPGKVSDVSNIQSDYRNTNSTDYNRRFHPNPQIRNYPNTLVKNPDVRYFANMNSQSSVPHTNMYAQFHANQNSYVKPVLVSSSTDIYNNYAENNTGHNTLSFKEQGIASNYAGMGNLERNKSINPYINFIDQQNNTGISQNTHCLKMVTNNNIPDNHNSFCYSKENSQTLVQKHTTNSGSNCGEMNRTDFNELMNMYSSNFHTQNLQNGSVTQQNNIKTLKNTANDYSVVDNVDMFSNLELLLEQQNRSIEYNVDHTTNHCGFKERKSSICSSNTLPFTLPEQRNNVFDGGAEPKNMANSIVLNSTKIQNNKYYEKENSQFTMYLDNFKSGNTHLKPNNVVSQVPQLFEHSPDSFKRQESPPQHYQKPGNAATLPLDLGKDSDLCEFFDNLISNPIENKCGESSVDVETLKRERGESEDDGNMKKVRKEKPKLPAQKKYLCKTCKKQFARPSTLQTHIYSHTGERPFMCTFPGCKKNFSVLSNLRRHEKNHNEDKTNQIKFRNIALNNNKMFAKQQNFSFVYNYSYSPDTGVGRKHKLITESKTHKNL
ncbi:hypothetical protein BB558_000727 [Smittium angustum]|uniref:C2H2-type domain-containing protein n=1 Tax=Smittium angustum TaxID=133377 RepID=A0A2U1JDC3_SMIAN|nr:hypothetical protein BB558_000727 [Smittium angustum]